MNKRILIVNAILLFSLSMGIAIFNKGQASAVSGSNWQAGRIIDDAVFTDPNAMSVPQIQDFLNRKVGTGGYDGVPGQCDTSGARSAQPFSNSTRAQYAASLSRPTTFTCLNNYYEVPKTEPGPGIPANNYGGAPIPAGARSAAQLIWDAAQRYNISPKVLLVTIQKESAGPLTTDDWPFQKQYTYAMGAYCPDSGPGGAANCNENYAGFSIQISESAALKRYYLDNMDKSWWPYKKLGNNTILYQNSKPECGSSIVNITTRATAALYTYTPYQPNQAAINNMYGTGDACSAYGNRNFWRIYNDWFGTAYANAYEARPYSQSPYPTITSAEPKTVYISFANLGFARWYDDVSVPQGGNPLHLAATDPINRGSRFSATWPSLGRPSHTFSKVYESDGKTLASNQHAVEPGQIAQFEFQLTVDSNVPPGVYRESFQPVLEGAANWNMGGIAWLDVTVASAYKAEYKGQSPYPSIVSNTKTNSYLEYRNIGTAYWYDDLTAKTNNTAPIHLATTAPINRSSSFSGSWPSASRPTGLFAMVYAADGVTPSQFQHVVRPGEIVHFDFDLTASANLPIGVNREYFQPIVEGSPNWQMGGVAWVDATVVERTGNAQYISQSNPPAINRGSSSPEFITYRNNTNFPWYDDASVPTGLSPLHFATTAPINRYSAFSYGWPSYSRPTNLFAKVYEADGVTLAGNQHIVQPGQIGRFEFSLTPPWSFNVGSYREYFQPLLEGAQNWNVGGVGWFDVTVLP